MQNTSGGVAQGVNNTLTTASGSGTNNIPASSAQLLGKVPGLYPNTSPLPSPDESYVNKPAHIGTVARWRMFLIDGFHTNGLSNRIVGRMVADHLLFLRANKLNPSKTYYCEYLNDWLHD